MRVGAEPWHGLCKNWYTVAGACVRLGQESTRTLQKNRMKLLTKLSAAFSLFALATAANAVIVDFTGGTAYLVGGGTYTPTDTGGYNANVDYYIEDGIKIDFVGGPGIIGNYYGSFPPYTDDNSVIHAHWFGLSSVVFSKVDGSNMDLNYVDLTSNTFVGGGKATGTEISHITPSGGGSLLLPSSDWGINYLSSGAPGDGIKRLWLPSSFDGITSFTVTSQNAYCFGLDNFYIDEAAPQPTPDAGSVLVLLSISLIGLAGFRARLRS